MKAAVTVAKNVMEPLADMAPASAIDEITLFISNKDMGTTIRIIKSLKRSGVSLDGVIETIKHV